MTLFTSKKELSFDDLVDVNGFDLLTTGIYLFKKERGLMVPVDETVEIKNAGGNIELTTGPRGIIKNRFGPNITAYTIDSRSLNITDSPTNINIEGVQSFIAFNPVLNFLTVYFGDPVDQGWLKSGDITIIDDFGPKYQLIDDSMSSRTEVQFNYEPSHVPTILTFGASIIHSNYKILDSYDLGFLTWFTIPEIGNLQRVGFRLTTTDPIGVLTQRRTAIEPITGGLHVIDLYSFSDFNEYSMNIDPLISVSDYTVSINGKIIGSFPFQTTTLTLPFIRLGSGTTGGTGYGVVVSDIYNIFYAGFSTKDLLITNRVTNYVLPSGERNYIIRLEVDPAIQNGDILNIIPTPFFSKITFESEVGSPKILVDGQEKYTIKTGNNVNIYSFRAYKSDGNYNFIPVEVNNSFENENGVVTINTSFTLTNFIANTDQPILLDTDTFETVFLSTLVPQSTGIKFDSIYNAGFIKNQFFPQPVFFSFNFNYSNKLNNQNIYVEAILRSSYQNIYGATIIEEEFGSSVLGKSTFGRFNILIEATSTIQNKSPPLSLFLKIDRTSSIIIELTRFSIYSSSPF